MSYRTLTSLFAVPVLSLAAVVACSADPDDPYSGAPADQTSGVPRNADGPIPVGGGANMPPAVVVDDSEDNGAGGGGMGGGAMGDVSSGMGGGAMGDVSLGMGGGAMGEVSVPMDVGVCDAVADVFQVSCAGSGCHDAPGTTIGDFAVDEATAFLFEGVSPIINGATCGPMIDTADPLNSAILRKTDAQPCGGQSMPPGGAAPISATQRTCLEDWLSQF